MTDTDTFAANFSLCERNGIRAFAVPNGRSRFRIDLEERLKTKTKITKGKLYYPEKTTRQEIGVYDKIKELYATLAQRIKNKRNNQ